MRLERIVDCLPANCLKHVKLEGIKPYPVYIRRIDHSILFRSGKDAAISQVKVSHTDNLGRTAGSLRESYDNLV